MVHGIKNILLDHIIAVVHLIPLFPSANEQNCQVHDTKLTILEKLNSSYHINQPKTYLNTILWWKYVNYTELT